MIRRRLRSLGSRPEEGTSLIELLVGMALMAVFMTIFAAAITTMYRSANKAESINTSSAQLSQAYTRMDSVVRYASAISEPGRGADGNWYVEVATTNTGRVAPVCTQFRLDGASKQLQQRGPEPAGAFRPIATNLDIGAAGESPFTRIAATRRQPAQKLTLRLTSTSGSAADSTTTSLSVVTLTAINSTIDSPTADVCPTMVRS